MKHVFVYVHDRIVHFIKEVLYIKEMTLRRSNDLICVEM
jgi:hypothetical protein